MFGRHLPGMPRLAVLVVLALAGGLALSGGASARTDSVAYINPGGGGTLCGNTEVAPPDGGTTCTYDWQVSPAYTGPTYTDGTAADAAEPPPPAPVTRAIPTWRNLYDWPNGHGYVGWHTASSSAAGQYGIQSNLGGQYGLWLWPTGGTGYGYTQGQYAEWTYTAPGTTRLSSVSLTFTYRNKLLAHHCIDFGFRNAAGAIVTHNEHCTPVQPPDSQRLTTLSLVDPSANPTSKVLYFRIRVDCGGASTCSKNIPALDPLSTGGYARLTKADAVLVDDDNPVLTRTTDSVDNFNDVYHVSVAATDAGSGVKSLQIERVGGSVFASANAPCDPAHHTDALDNRICPQAFGLDGTLDVSDLEDGTYTFRATAVDVAGNVGTLTWTVTLDRTSLDVTQNPLTATPRDRYTTATQGEWGWTGRETIPAARTRQGYKWRVALGANQTLQKLSTGGVAVVTPPTADTTDPSVDNYSDDTAADPATVGPIADAPDVIDGAADDYTDDGIINDSPDSAPAVTSPSVDTAFGAIAAAQDEIDNGSVDAVIQAPTAADASGAPVAVAFTIKGNVVTLTVGHQGAPHAYPVTATAAMLDNGNDLSAVTSATVPAPFSALRTLTRSRAVADATCPARPKIVVYGQDGWFILLAALKAHPTPCADYFINMNSPAAPKDPVTGKVTNWEPKRHPNATYVQTICGANAVDTVVAAHAHFYALAEFSTNAWQNWVGSNRGTWYQAGVTFRKWMKEQAGLGTTTCSATPNDIKPLPELWSVNEFPTNWTLKAVRKDGTVITAAAERRNLRNAMQGLFTGPAGYAHVRGFPFILNKANEQTYFDKYRPGLQAAVADSNFWKPLQRYVAFIGQEAYTNCFKNCVTGASVAARSRYVNAYMMHTADLAFATGAPSTTGAARGLFGPRYYPLMNAFCCSARPYGWTSDLNWVQKKGLVSLEIYSARRRATGLPASSSPGTSTRVGAYPRLTIGLSWKDVADTSPDYNSVKDLATQVATALAAAYDPAAGTAVRACTIDAVNAPNGNWCTVIAHTPASPELPEEREGFNPCWLRFQNWSQSAANCS